MTTLKEYKETIELLIYALEEITDNINGLDGLYSFRQVNHFINHAKEIIGKE